LNKKMMGMKFEKLVVYDFSGSDFLSDSLKGLSKETVVIRTDKDFSGEMKPENLRGADAFVAKPFGDYDKSFLSKADKLKYFGLVSTSYAVVDVDFLKSRDVTFTNVPHYATEAVAELTFSALLAIPRKTHESVTNAKEDYSAKRYIGWELQGKTIGIIGLGSIGTRVAEIAKCFGMGVVYHSRTKKPGAESNLGIKYVGLDELLGKSDIVSLNLSLNEQTKGILGRDKLNLLKEGAVVLNSARAELCDLKAVRELAESGKVVFWFDGLDEKEQRERLLGLNNVIATPHIGWLTKEAQKRLDEVAVKNVKNFLKGKPTNVVR
jgi:lactate dehydrogenase-like 2-hydroxyacid dehydrogenase